MSDKIVENLLEQIKGLAVSERNKFSSYKSRMLRQNLSESEAVIKAAAKLGIFPPTLEEPQRLLEAVGDHPLTQGKILFLPNAAFSEELDIPSSNTPPTASNTLRAAESSVEEIEQKKMEAGGEDRSASNTSNEPAPTIRREYKWHEIALTIFFGAAFLFCTASLIYLAAESAGGDRASYFWAFVIEGGGILCLIWTAKGWKKAGLWAVGLLCIVLGFSTMMTTVLKKSDSDLSQTVSTNGDVKDLEAQIANSTRNIAAMEKTRDELPSNRISKRNELQTEINQRFAEQTKLYDSLKAARGGARVNTSANLIGLWTGVEGLRRFLLVVFGVIVGHAFCRSVSKWINV